MSLTPSSPACGLPEGHSDAARGARRGGPSRAPGRSGPPGGLGGQGRRAAWAAAVLDLSGLVVPLDCAGCHRPDDVLCPACSQWLSGQLRRVDEDAPRLGGPGTPQWPVLAATAYVGPVREMVVAWKDRGRADLTDRLSQAVAEVAQCVADDLWATIGRRTEVWVVAAPSSAAARRRRGREPVLALADAVVRVLVARRVGARTSTAAESRGGRTGPAGRAGGGAEGRVRRVRALRHSTRLRSRVRDQAGLGSRARGRNLAGALRLTRAARRELAVRRLDGCPSAARKDIVCVLVDDVITTGATFAECERVLAQHGVRVVAGIVLAATPAPGQGRRVPGDGSEELLATGAAR